MHFDGVELGDERRNRRLPQLVDELVRHPGGTLPQKLPRPADQEAFSRLCSADDVTQAAVLAPHRKRLLQTLQNTKQFLLVVHDATEFDFSSRTSLRKLGQIGNGHGRGDLAQQSLVVDPRQGTVLGLANQILHTRVQTPLNEGVAAKRERESRASRLWLEGVQGLPARREIIDVCDRGADTFEFLEQEVHSGRTFVIRASHDRSIRPTDVADDAAALSLFEFARGLPSLGASETTVRIPAARRGKSRKDLPVLRIAPLQVSAAPMRVLAPHVRRGAHGREPLLMWIVRIWESHPPAGCEPLEWLLLTNHPAQTLAAARRVKTWYEWRWIIEDYHKGQKTGCAVEDLQFRDEERLQPALAVLSIVALTLLQLRNALRDPTASRRRAADVIEPEAILVLSQWTEGEPRPDWSLEEYTLALARLGGYRRRKNSPPGWQTLWRGQTKLELMLDGVRTIHKLRNSMLKDVP